MKPSILLVHYFMIFSCFFSCSSKKDDANDNSTFSVELVNLEAHPEKSAPSDFEKILNSARSGKELRVSEVLSVLNKNYQNKISIDINKNEIISELDKRNYNKESIGESKRELFDLYQEKNEVLYNMDAINIFDLDRKSRFQCSSGTWNIWSVYLELNPAAINSKNLVNIYTKGHILPGEVINENGVNILYGYESTVLGRGKVNFGDITQLSSAIRVVDFKFDFLLQALKGYYRGTKALRDEALQKTKEKFNLNLQRTESLISSDAFSVNKIKIELKKLNQSVFSFGAKNVKKGDQKIPRADLISGNSYGASGPVPSDFQIIRVDESEQSVELDTKELGRIWLSYLGKAIEGFEVHGYYDSKVNWIHPFLYESRNYREKEGLSLKILVEEKSTYHNQQLFLNSYYPVIVINGNDKDFVSNLINLTLCSSWNEHMIVTFHIDVCYFNEGIKNNFIDNVVIKKISSGKFHLKTTSPEEMDSFPIEMIFDFTINPQVNPKVIKIDDREFHYSLIKVEEEHRE
jgi:hypothetical protein